MKNKSLENIHSAKLGIISEQDGQITIALAQSIKDRFFAHVLSLGMACNAPEFKSTGNAPHLPWHMTLTATKAELIRMASAFTSGNEVELHPCVTR